MSSSPHYCRCIWLCYPNHRACVHFLLEWVNVSFPRCRYKTPFLLQRDLKAKLLAEVAVSGDTEDSLLIWLALKKSALRLIFKAVTLVSPSFPLWASTRHLSGVKHLSCWSKTSLSFSYWNIYTLSLLCMPYVLH